MKVGFVGWRGMVGSVLMERMRACQDFDLFEPVFFSTSQAGGAAPAFAGGGVLRDAGDLAALGECGAIVTCQGGDWTLDVHPRLRAGHRTADIARPGERVLGTAEMGDAVLAALQAGK